MKRALIIAALALVAGVAYAQNVAIYMEQGGARQVVGSGGSLDVASGGEIDVESGGSLKIAGTAVTSSAAELNKLTGVTATTAEINKLAGATATVAELNLTDNMPANITFAYAAGAANVSEVTITVKDAAGATIASVFNLDVWLSDAATCAGLTGTSASGTVQAKAASGADLEVMTAKKALRVQTLATGIYILEITDTGKTGFYPCATLPSTGSTKIGTQMVSGDYGA